MKAANVRLIFRREISDQWRDRRTLFTVVVMPLVLYPLMGMAMLQTAQFLRSDPGRILLANSVSASEEGQPDAAFDDAAWSTAEARLTAFLSEGETAGLTVHTWNTLDSEYATALAEALRDPAVTEERGHLRSLMKRGGYNAMIVRHHEPNPDEGDARAIHELQIITDSSSDHSAMVTAAVSRQMEKWRGELLKERLADLGVQPDDLATVRWETTDVASSPVRKAALWSKVLPFIVLVWALTGAFYPAIDLCAGEKERGTLETLLCSPAKRSEIVAGKLLTVIAFSVATALLNLCSMTATGLFVMGKLSGAAGGALTAGIGLPPLSAIPWLVIGMLPLAALFSSLALALASFAKSSKEGQYYLIPLLMSLLPLMMLSMLPSARLELGTSLIPVTGMLLLMRSLMIGEYALAFQFLGPVLAITLVCCWLAIRWAVFQFNNESVLFRAGEQFGISAWLRHLVRDRGPLPTVGEAILCGVIILVIKFFVGLSATMEPTFAGFARQVVVTQVATIALPAILLAAFLTRGPLESLKLSRPSFRSVPACILMAICLHPAFVAISHVVMYLYPASAGLQGIEVTVQRILADAPGPWAIIAVIAIVPAFCEEIAFRGFVLSGLQSIRGKWTAILGSALLFGIAHGILQQSIMASLTGVVLGIISVQTRSLIPCVAYHAVHNAMPVFLGNYPQHAIEGSWLQWFLDSHATSGANWSVLATVLLPIVGLAILVWIWRGSDADPAPSEARESAKPVMV